MQIYCAPMNICGFAPLQKLNHDSINHSSFTHLCLNFFLLILEIFPTNFPFDFPWDFVKSEGYTWKSHRVGQILYTCASVRLNNHSRSILITLKVPPHSKGVKKRRTGGNQVQEVSFENTTLTFKWRQRTALKKMKTLQTFLETSSWKPNTLWPLVVVKQTNYFLRIIWICLYS